MIDTVKIFTFISQESFEVIKRECGVRIDIWTHFMRGCIIDYVH